jgi:hypothetical protein
MVKGYPPTMPALSLTEDELKHVIAYVKDLR